LGKRTGGGFNLVGVDVLHGSTMAGSVMRSPKSAMFLGISCSVKSSLACGETISVVHYCNLAPVSAR
jgi:hypothetical protein